LTFAIAGDAMADALDLAELLEVDVDVRLGFRVRSGARARQAPPRSVD
jgi:hypothetical protein